MNRDELISKRARLVHELKEVDRLLKIDEEHKRQEAWMFKHGLSADGFKFYKLDGKPLVIYYIYDSTKYEIGFHYRKGGVNKDDYPKGVLGLRYFGYEGSPTQVDSCIMKNVTLFEIKFITAVMSDYDNARYAAMEYP
jgi:hypothetical protein